MHEVINRQRKVKIRLDDFKKFLEIIFLVVEEAEKKSAVIAFVSDNKMRELNKEFRGKKQTTDVLSFPFEPDEFDADENFLGDIIISAEQAERQAKENKLSFEREIKQLILHGILHLCDYDHETDSGEMNARELELRKRLKI